MGSFLRYFRVDFIAFNLAIHKTCAPLHPSIVTHYELAGIKERFRRFIRFSTDRLSRLDHLIKTLFAMKSPQAKRESLLSKQLFHVFQSRKGLIWLPKESYLAANC